jgi:hypothetical protein
VAKRRVFVDAMGVTVAEVAINLSAKDDCETLPPLILALLRVLNDLLVNRPVQPYAVRRVLMIRLRNVMAAFILMEQKSTEIVFTLFVFKISDKNTSAVELCVDPIN